MTAMSNADIILEFLEHDRARQFCDGCISKQLGIKPRQQVNQVCNKLSKQGAIHRADGTCARCGGSTKVNALAADGAVEPKKARAPARAAKVSQQVDVERMRTEIVHRCQELWGRARKEAPPESVSAFITTLREDKVIPRHQANMMLTICNLRNVYVWDRVPFGDREKAVASAAWEIIDEWWKGRRGK